MHMRDILDMVAMLREASDDALTFRTESRGFYSGQSDLTLRAYLHDEEVGHIDYSVYRGEPAVQMISVPKQQHQRHGYATAMVHQLQSEFPDVEVAMGSLTDQGGKLLASIPQEVIHNPEYQRRAQRLEQVKAELAQLQHDYEHNFPTDQQERMRLSDHWNDLNQQEWELEQELHYMQASKRLFRHSVAEAKEPKKSRRFRVSWGRNQRAKLGDMTVDAPDERAARKIVRQQLEAMYFRHHGMKILYTTEVSGELREWMDEALELMLSEASEYATDQKKRAAEMGYTIKAYHGSSVEPVQRFAPHSLYKYTERDYFGASFTPDPRTASHYSTARSGSHPHIMPVLIKGPLYLMSQDEERRIGNAKDARDLRKRLEAEGYTGIWFDWDDEIKVWTPSALRLAHAKFDPEQHANDDLLA